MEFHFMHASWNLVRQLARENYTENNMFTITNQWMDNMFTITNQDVWYQRMIPAWLRRRKNVPSGWSRCQWYLRSSQHSQA